MNWLLRLSRTAVADQSLRGVAAFMAMMLVVTAAVAGLWGVCVLADWLLVGGDE